MLVNGAARDKHEKNLLARAEPERAMMTADLMMAVVVVGIG
jgi:hypothetical protein